MSSAKKDTDSRSNFSMSIQFWSLTTKMCQSRLSFFTLCSLKDADVGPSLIASKEMIWITSFVTRIRCDRCRDRSWPEMNWQLTLIHLWTNFLSSRRLSFTLINTCVFARVLKGDSFRYYCLNPTSQEWLDRAKMHLVEETVTLRCGDA